MRLEPVANSVAHLLCATLRHGRKDLPACPYYVAFVYPQAVTAKLNAVKLNRMTRYKEVFTKSDPWSWFAKQLRSSTRRVGDELRGKKPYTYGCGGRVSEISRRRMSRYTRGKWVNWFTGRHRPSLRFMACKSGNPSIPSPELRSAGSPPPPFPQSRGNERDGSTFQL